MFAVPIKTYIYDTAKNIVLFVPVVSIVYLTGPLIIIGAALYALFIFSGSIVLYIPTVLCCSRKTIKN